LTPCSAQLNKKYGYYCANKTWVEQRKLPCSAPCLTSCSAYD
jgi:hypothetical protein